VVGPTVESKDDFRRAMRARRAALPADEQSRASLAVAQVGLADAGLTGARVVAAYVAMKGELDAWPLGDALAARGALLVLPRVVDPGPGGVLTFHRADSPLVASKFGVLEPAADAPVVPLDDIDVFLVPGLCFDGRGARIGWGRGHYDATLACAPAARRLGVAYSFQIVPAAPESSGDERMDGILTETGALTTNARSLLSVRRTR
jgi:5-formyltetrahydrofolate cyclo-ligase